MEFPHVLQRIGARIGGFLYGLVNWADDIGFLRKYISSRQWWGVLEISVLCDHVIVFFDFNNIRSLRFSIMYLSKVLTEG